MDIINFDTNNSITEGTKASVIKILYEINLDLRNLIYSHDDYGTEGFYHFRLTNVDDWLNVSFGKDYDYDDEDYDDFEQAKSKMELSIYDYVDDLFSDIFWSMYDKQTIIEEIEFAIDNFDIDEQLNYFSMLDNSYFLLIKIINPDIYKYHIIKVDFSTENFELFDSYTKLEEMVSDLNTELEKINNKTEIISNLETKFIIHDKEIELFSSGMGHKLQKWPDIPVTKVIKYMTNYIPLNTVVNDVMYIRGLIILKI